ncbi:hypothetical protein LguiA_003950 [Lonicera macranthoides]
MEGSMKPPQISEMFQKKFIAFKSKIIEFFAEEDEPFSATVTTDEFTLLDSAEEEFIPDQKIRASYLQLQTAHVPFDEETTAYKALVSHFHRVYDLRQIYTNSRKSPNFNFDYVIGTSLKAHV